ncbi:helix-turn-helix domain-containing protein [Prescottella equi]|uniref:helix-turn-helix domain-containing protein n=1 Tax=Rhodococcus hoagii TaxID=43767 RepID=UPI0019807EB1|nr:helix-turn-helix domain-containing protein [Prescottella equi]MBM4497543.1 helix-turn-helix domain-containing protein [Prescottella equi]MBM4655599.1 helix-turn-helix domain-containing protein [Prescottella equi]MBM4718795.1 helix-turn-helix domain-containing protein [Prescottella equi]NKR20838.1 helix-turn-helix domain-containing protein [Prescottella equi]NKT52857.1 helix-turn-helix domain-containing protein [Prescottella equi]
MATRWTDEEGERLTELHAEGKSLHFIANELGRSKALVSTHAKRLNLSFDRTRTAKAAEAVHVDNKARRAALEERLLTEADKVLDQMWSPALVYSFGGAANEYNEHTLDKPAFSDQKAIMQTASTALTAANKLHELNSGHDAAAAISTLAEIHAAITAMADEDPEEPPTPTDEELDAEAEG